jgi:hypothetical protein
VQVQSSDLLPDTLTMDLSPSATDDSSSGPLSNALGGSSVVLVTEADNGLRTAHTLLTRITQPNGIALLVCAAVILIWMLFRCVMSTDWINVCVQGQHTTIPCHWLLMIAAV